MKYKYDKDMKTTFSLLSLVFLSIILTYTIGCFYSYFYPMSYSQEIIKYSQEYDVDSALVASVINTESSFKENVQSQKGAVGLMQLMPSTAEWLAGKVGEEYSDERLYEPEFNIKLGSYYLSYLIKYFGDRELAICAYNAGQGNVSNWLEDKRYSTDGKTLDNIPFEETKNYLIKVYKNYRYYKNKYK